MDAINQKEKNMFLQETFKWVEATNTNYPNIFNKSWDRRMTESNWKVVNVMNSKN